MTDYNDITLELANGKRAYVPRNLQFIRLFPASLAQIGKRVTDCREILKELIATGEISEQTARHFDKVVRPLPLEERILSGKIIEVHDAILKIIENE